MALNPLLLVTLLVAVASAALPVFHEDAKDKVNNDEDDDNCRKTVTDDDVVLVVGPAGRTVSLPQRRRCQR